MPRRRQILVTGVASWLGRPAGPAADSPSRLHSGARPSSNDRVGGSLARITLSDQLRSLLCHGRVLSTSRATRLLKFRPELDTQSAYLEFLENARVLSYPPDRQHHQIAEELEGFIRSRAPSRRRG